MCGIIAYSGAESSAPLIFEGLSLLQHRGQDAAGIVTMEGTHLFMHKGYGLARDVFGHRHLDTLRGSVGLGHVRYPTAGSARALSEIQPFYVNSPFGMVLVHNGNLTNAAELRDELSRAGMRHINTESDSEVLLNLLAHELTAAARSGEVSAEVIFAAIRRVHARCRGAYSVAAMIAGFGLAAFRDPHGIRPLVFGERISGGRREVIVASESVALRALGFSEARDLSPGEALAVGPDGIAQTRLCAEESNLRPCIFEYIYLARPDSVLDGALVYETRINMGRALADKIRRDYADVKIDSVIPVPDSARPAAMQLAHELNLPYREGLVKNRYIGRTFIMPGANLRRRAVRRKLNIVDAEFRNKRILLVDDSVVRGTTSREIVQMARDAGARKIYFASAAPPVRHPNVYGIDMPTSDELIAAGRDDSQVALRIGADLMIYQNLDALIKSVRAVNPQLNGFETSCFDGEYLGDEVTAEYLAKLAEKRRADRDDEMSNFQRDLSFHAAP